MHATPPEIRVLQIFIGPVAQHVSDIGAHERGREITTRPEAVNHRRRSPEQQGKLRARGFPFCFRFLARRDVAPRSNDLDRFAVTVVDDVLPVVDPAIGAVIPPVAIFD